MQQGSVDTNLFSSVDVVILSLIASNVEKPMLAMVCVFEARTIEPSHLNSAEFIGST